MIENIPSIENFTGIARRSSWQLCQSVASDGTSESLHQDSHLGFFISYRAH